MRILTKWCEELWEKFETETYFTDRTEGLSMLNKKEIKYLEEHIRESLKELIQSEKKRIDNEMKKIIKTLYEQEYKILQS